MLFTRNDNTKSTTRAEYIERGMMTYASGIETNAGGAPSVNTLNVSKVDRMESQVPFNQQ